jgi:hypothetical protein
MIPANRPHASIYVIVYEDGAVPSLAYELSRAMTDALGAHTGARKSTVLTGIEFDTRFVDRDIAAFGADAVLTIRMVGARTGGRHGETTDLIYGATLEDRASHQPVWAARVEISGAVGAGIEPAAGKIVAALAQDHMIPPAVVSPCRNGSTWPSAPRDPDCQ